MDPLRQVIYQAIKRVRRVEVRRTRKEAIDCMLGCGKILEVSLGDSHGLELIPESMKACAHPINRSNPIRSTTPFRALLSFYPSQFSLSSKPSSIYLSNFAKFCHVSLHSLNTKTFCHHPKHPCHVLDRFVFLQAAMTHHPQ